MKFGSHIKPRNGHARHVTVLDKPHVFAPVKATDGTTHFVADVDDPDVAALLAQSPHFYAFDPASVAKATLRRKDAAGTKAAAVAEVQPAPPVSEPVETKYDAATLAEARALLDQPLASMGTAIGQASGVGVIRAALALEQAAGKRKTVIDLLNRTIECMVQAGVAAL